MSPRTKWLGLGILALGVAAILWWPQEPEPQVPVIDLHGFDPLVAAQIRQATEQVHASRGSGPAWGQLGMTLHVHELSAEADLCYRRAARLEPREGRWPYLH